MQPSFKSTSNQSIRHVRIERKSGLEISAEENQSWAVSYSDLLMVLMSFFVLFFSFEGRERENMLSKIRMEIGGKTDKSSTGKLPIRSTSRASTTGELSTHIPSQQGASKEKTSETSDGQMRMNEKASIMNTIGDRISRKQFAVTKEKNSGELVIDLSNQIYERRVFSINSKISTELDQVLKILEPYKNKVYITFIGHSDSLQLTNGSTFLANNFDLSSLRASRAMSYAIQKGFNPRRLSIGAMGENLRNSRSLSLRVTQTQ